MLEDAFRNEQAVLGIVTHQPAIQKKTMTESFPFHHFLDTTARQILKGQAQRITDRTSPQASRRLFRQRFQEC